MIDDSSGVRRRTVLKRTGASALAVGAAALPAGCLGSGGDYDVYEGEEFVEDEPDYDGWLSDAGHEGTVDWTGEDEVTVLVGTGSQGRRFGPAGIRVDAGTTVVWEWTGAGGRHDVVARDDGFASDQYSGDGATFEHGFDESGTYAYSCLPHERHGMKGAVDVV